MGSWLCSGAGVMTIGTPEPHRGAYLLLEILAGILAVITSLGCILLAALIIKGA